MSSIDNPDRADFKVVLGGDADLQEGQMRTKAIWGITHRVTLLVIRNESRVVDLYDGASIRVDVRKAGRISLVDICGVAWTTWL